MMAVRPFFGAVWRFGRGPRLFAGLAWSSSKPAKGGGLAFVVIVVAWALYQCSQGG